MIAKYIPLIALVAALAQAVPTPTTKVPEYSRFIDLAGEDGKMHKVDLEEVPDMELLARMARNPADNRYYLYTQNNPTSSQEIVMNNADTIRNSNFDASRPLVVIAHGWLGNQNANLNDPIKNAILANENVNIIVLDWGRLALSGYVTSATGVPAVGRGLGMFLEWLHLNTGVQYSQMHLVGFSLGAHLVGNAGRHLAGKLGRITGLDPAGPLWHYNSDRLSAADARYVEAIHTNGGIAYALGIGTSIAHADFYPNGGNNQPGCWTMHICDHNRAWEFFAATVSYNHLIARECTSSLQLTLNRCTGQELPMGNNDINKWGVGNYRVNTARRYPY